MVCFHKWTQWSHLVPTYNGIMQYTRCIKCNKVVHRKAFCGNNANLPLYNTEERRESMLTEDVESRL